eukprot:TRINITY_DN100451_c0_g1_i1.p1 TRINITY_DN100451_c0_g1~~TRINITY_DN100451_c0_g1_i1.p1  ORF type:complete len:806 (+),score=171.50 TRINITY_DN100451_c0_g1_i1:129-2546(+)
MWLMASRPTGARQPSTLSPTPQARAQCSPLPAAAPPAFGQAPAAAIAAPPAAVAATGSGVVAFASPRGPFAPRARSVSPGPTGVMVRLSGGGDPSAGGAATRRVTHAATTSRTVSTSHRPVVLMARTLPQRHATSPLIPGPCTAVGGSSSSSSYPAARSGSITLGVAPAAPRANPVFGGGSLAAAQGPAAVRALSPQPSRLSPNGRLSPHGRLSPNGRPSPPNGKEVLSTMQAFGNGSTDSQQMSPPPAFAYGASSRLLLDLRRPLAEVAASNPSEYSPRDSVWKRYFCQDAGASGPSETSRLAGSQGRPYEASHIQEHDQRLDDYSSSTLQTQWRHSPPAEVAEDRASASHRGEEESISGIQGMGALSALPTENGSSLVGSWSPDPFGDASLAAASRSSVVPQNPGAAPRLSQSPGRAEYALQSPGRADFAGPPAQERVRPGEARSMAKEMGHQQQGQAQVLSPQEEEASQALAHARCMETVAAAADSVSPQDLQMLASIERPHSVIREVVEVTLMLLGFREATWAASQVYFKDPVSFVEKLRGFDASRSVSRLQYQKLLRSFQGAQNAFAPGQAESACPAARSLVQWCRAVGYLLAWRYGAMTSPSATSCSTNGTADGETRRSAREESWRESRLQQPMCKTPPPPAGPPAAGVGDDVLLPKRPQLGDLEVLPDIYSLSAEALRRVCDLTVRKPGVGQVIFHGEMDLLRERQVLEELPSIVRLDTGEVILYPDPGTKPTEGSGLNRPATITLFGCMPPNGGGFQDAESKARYRSRIAAMTEAKGAKFVDYDCDVGTWQFRVEHF